MARVYRALGVTTGSFEAQIRQKARWSVLSFTRLEKKTPELSQAEKAANIVCTPPLYRFELYRHGPALEKDGGRKVHDCMITTLRSAIEPISRRGRRERSY